MSSSDGVGRRERKKLERRELILNRAKDLFERNGFDGVSLEAIAEAADVSLGTLYNFFPTKLDVLFSAFLRTLLERLGEAMKRLEDPPTDPVEGLYLWAEIHFRAYASFDRDLLMRSAIHGLMQGHRRGGGHEYADLDLFAEAGMRELLELYMSRGSLSPELDVHGLTELLFAAGNGEFFRWISDPAEDVEGALARLRRHIELIAKALSIRVAA